MPSNIGSSTSTRVSSSARPNEERPESIVDTLAWQPEAAAEVTMER
jgi:hypothetical protein